MSNPVFNPVPPRPSDVRVDKNVVLAVYVATDLVNHDWTATNVEKLQGSSVASHSS